VTDDRAVLEFLDRRTIGQIGLGFGIAALVVFLLVDSVGTRAVLSRLARTELRWLALACLSTLLCLTAWGRA